MRATMHFQKVDLDLLSCFPKNGQESLEGRVGIELSKCATMEERERKKSCWKKWGRSLPAWGRPRARPGRLVCPPYFSFSFIKICLKNFPREKCHNFHPRTPFSIILDSLESSQRAQQDYAEKHHSPTWYYKNKWGKVKPLSRKPETPYLFANEVRKTWNQFCWKEDDKCYPWKWQTSNGDFAKKWKREIFHTDEPAKSPIPKPQ